MPFESKKPSPQERDLQVLLAQLDIEPTEGPDAALDAILDDIETAAKHAGLTIRHRLRAAVRIYCNTVAAPSTTAWIREVANATGIKERMAYTYLAAGEILARHIGPGQGGVRNEALLRLDLPMLELLKGLDAKQLAFFLTMNKTPWEMSRSEIRDAVAKIVGRERPPATPKPVQLVFPGLDVLEDYDRAPLDLETDLQYFGAFGERVKAHVATLDDETYQELRANIQEELEAMETIRNQAKRGLQVVGG